jgi:hypothetical protein
MAERPAKRSALRFTPGPGKAATFTRSNVKDAFALVPRPWAVFLSSAIAKTARTSVPPSLNCVANVHDGPSARSSRPCARLAVAPAESIQAVLAIAPDALTIKPQLTQ